MREKTSAQFILRCCELNLSWDMLDHVDPGTVYDMLVERANDYEEYPYKAEQEDYDAFFGAY